MTTLPTIPVAADIEVGNHITRTIFGLTFNIDTIYVSAGAALVLIGLSLYLRAKSSAENPSKVQLAWEAIVTYVQNEVEGSLGKVNTYVIQLSVALFTFILLCNLVELIPSGEHPKILPAPTSDINLTLAMALLVIVGVHIHSFRQRGFKGYFAHYAQPYKALIVLNIIEEIVKPFTLALRLFGNIFAGGIMIAIIGLIPIWGSWAPTWLWKVFDSFIGLIQAFIFALLTIIYFGMAGATHDDHADDDHATADAHPDAHADAAERELTNAH